MREGAATGGTEVLAPAAGSLWFAHPPGAGNGCVSIKVDGGGGLIVQMCHIVLHRVMRPNEPVAAGDSLGVIGEAGRVGNNGVAHLHLSMHRTPDYGVTRIAAPFASGAGIPLEGLNLAADGSRNQYVCPGPTCLSQLVSSNSARSAPVAAPAPPPPPRVGAPPPSTALRTGARAVVAGAGDCVNIREAPSTSARVKQCLPDGARLRIVEGPVAGNGYQWWRLEGLGWAVSDYLSLVAPALEVGGNVRVSPGVGECLNIRTAPGKSAAVVTCLSHGSPARLVGGPVEADGITWWQLDGHGWASGEFLAPED